MSQQEWGLRQVPVLQPLQEEPWVLWVIGKLQWRYRTLMSHSQWLLRRAKAWTFEIPSLVLGYLFNIEQLAMLWTKWLARKSLASTICCKSIAVIAYRRSAGIGPKLHQANRYSIVDRRSLDNRLRRNWFVLAHALFLFGRRNWFVLAHALFLFGYRQ